jgi:hypothetical protein
MLRVHADAYVHLGQSIAFIQGLFGLRDADPESGLPAENLSRDDMSQVSKTLAGMDRVCEQLGLVLSLRLIRSRLSDPPRNGREMQMLIDTVYAELGGRLFLYVPNERARFYDNQDVLGDISREAFPAAYRELKLAGNCLACGLWTASVFHSMRASEIGVRSMGSALGVSFPDKPLDRADWKNILDQADKKIAALSLQPKPPARDGDVQFYSTAAAEFRYLKDGWRNEVAHARASYDEDEATRIFNHTREFFEALSARLSE